MLCVPFGAERREEKNINIYKQNIEGKIEDISCCDNALHIEFTLFTLKCQLSL